MKRLILPIAIAALITPLNASQFWHGPPVAAGVSSITVSSNWGFVNSATSPATTTGTHTLTVPGGNSGDIKFTYVQVIGTPTPQYQKNGGTWTTFTQNQVINFANGDTIQLRGSGMLSGDQITMALYDNTTTAGIGTADLNRT